MGTCLSERVSRWYKTPLMQLPGLLCHDVRVNKGVMTVTDAVDAVARCAISKGDLLNNSMLLDMVCVKPWRLQCQ